MDEYSFIKSLISSLNESEKFLDIIFRSEELIKYFIRKSNFFSIKPQCELTLKKSTVVYQQLENYHDMFLKKLSIIDDFIQIINIYTEFNKTIKKKIDELLSSQIEDNVESAISLIFTIRYYQFLVSNFFKYFDVKLFSLADIFRIINISYEFGPRSTTVVIHNHSSHIPCVDNFLSSGDISEEDKKIIISYVETKFGLTFEKPVESGNLNRVFNYCHKTKYENIYPFLEETKNKIIFYRAEIESSLINNEIFKVNFI